MPSDHTTFAAAFGLLFGLILMSLWRLERQARKLEAKLDAIAATEKEGSR